MCNNKPPSLSVLSCFYVCGRCIQNETLNRQTHSYWHFAEKQHHRTRTHYTTLPVIIMTFARLIWYVLAIYSSYNTISFSINNIRVCMYSVTGTQWRHWLRHCDTSRKVADSIPHGVIEIFHWRNPFGRTQPLTEMSIRDIYWGVKAAGA